jgi:hypothetical protein
MAESRGNIMEERELKIDGVFYLTMLDGETEEQAKERFWNLSTQAGIVVGDCEFETQEV